MQAVIFCLISPVIPLLVWMGRQKDRRISARELSLRYAVYTLAMTLFATLVLAFGSDEGTSFWAKADASPVFLLKYALLEMAAAAILAFAEWIHAVYKPVVRVALREYQDAWIVGFVKKVLFPCGIYLTAAAMVILNIRLMFDNVLWGDECFSANTAQKSAGGILQVMYFWDNHPPLHYYWLKIFGDLFGHTGPVYHMASLTPFLIGVLLALVFLRRRFGNIPTAFFIIITGVAAPCLEYNLEIRMYSLAFLGVACCYYCAYRVLSDGKLAWFGMVFWALVGAYSHYYAMMTVGIMIFITGVAAAVRYRGKTWIKGLTALIAFIAGYAPWLKYLFHATENVSGSWWVSEILDPVSCMHMVLCGVEYERSVFCLLLVLGLFVFLVESSWFCVEREKNHVEITICKPNLDKWGNEAYGAAVGILTVAGTLIAAYGVCLIVGPVLVERYLYPLSAVTVLLLVILSSESLALIQKWGQKRSKNHPERWVKCALAAVLALLVVIGIGNYRSYDSQAKAEKTVTEQTFDLIGEVPEDTALVSNSVKHLAWTVLYYYYPDRKVVTGNCSDDGAAYDKFWYFTPDYVGEKELQEMYDMGYTAVCHDTCQIAVYPFVLYYFERSPREGVVSPGADTADDWNVVDTDAFVDLPFREISIDLSADDVEDTLSVFLHGSPSDAVSCAEELVSSYVRSIRVTVTDGATGAALYDRTFAADRIGEGQLMLVTDGNTPYLLESDCHEQMGYASYTGEVFGWKDGEKVTVDAFEARFLTDRDAVSRNVLNGEEILGRDDVIRDFRDAVESWSQGSEIVVACDLLNRGYYNRQSVFISTDEKKYALEDFYSLIWDRPSISYTVGTFDELMGYSGYYIYEVMGPLSVIYYYSEEGEQFADAGYTTLEETFSVDLDGDGVTELISNVCRSDGHIATLICRRDAGAVVTGYADELLDVEYDMINCDSEYSHYILEENVVEIFYWIDADNRYHSKKYEIDLDKITFSKYMPWM